MTELRISLPPAIQGWVDERLARGGFSDAEAYVRQLIERDRESYEANVERVRKMIDEGLASGFVDEEPEEILDEIIAGIPHKNG